MAYRPSSASRADRRGSQASTAPSSPALDCARRNCGGANARDERGLLPIPGPRSQGRILSNTSSPSKVSSPLGSPLPRGGRATPSISKTKLSRTVSAILPTPQNGSPPFAIGGRSHLLNGRLPFKVVQGNGPGNTVQVAQHSNLQLSKKLADGVIKKISDASKLASGLNKKEHPDGHQGLKSASKVFQDGSGTKEHEEEVDERKYLKGRRQERSHSGKELVEKSRQGEISVVTILQRPKNQEAAAELISKFFQKATEQEILTVKDDRVKGTSDDLPDFENSDGVVLKSETEGGLSEELSDYESSSEFGTGQNISFPSIKQMFLGVPGPDVDGDVQEPPMEGVMDGIHLTPSTTMMSECVEGQHDKEPLGSPEETEKYMVDGSGCDEFAPWERWAGPSYINSPPPSALPIPRFPRKQLKIQSSSITEYDEVTSDQIRARSSFITPSHTRMSGWQQPGIAWDAVATATKDLKRILNLDLCSVISS